MSLFSDIYHVNMCLLVPKTEKKCQFVSVQSPLWSTSRVYHLRFVTSPVCC